MGTRHRDLGKLGGGGDWIGIRSGGFFRSGGRLEIFVMFFKPFLDGMCGLGGIYRDPLLGSAVGVYGVYNNIMV